MLTLLIAAAPNPAPAATLGDAMPGFAPVQRHLGPVIGHESATDVVVQPDGRIVAAILNDAEADRRIVRLLPNGSLDPSFADDGVWHVPNPNATTVRALALAPDGSIVFAGEDLTRPALVIGRLTSAGVLDTTFSGDGLHVSVLDADSAPLIGSVLVEPDGRVVFAGVVNAPPMGDQLLLGRLLASGDDDPGFAGAPFQTFGSPYEGENDAFGGLARMSNGDFILGDARAISGPLVWRLPSDGRFQIAANVDLPDDLDVLRDLVATDAAHVMALVTDGSTGSAMAWLDVSETPRVVSGGGPDGVSRPFPGTFQAQQMLRQPGGGWIVSGVDSAPNPHRAIARLRDDTTLDSAFGSGGMQQLSGSSTYGFYLSTHAITQLANGAIVSGFHVNATPTRESAIDMLVGRLARVRVEVVAPPAAGLVETTTQFTVRIANDGPDGSGPGSVAFTMGTGLRVMSYTGTGCTGDAGGGRCRFGNLAAGESRDVLVRVRANAPGLRGMSAAVGATTFDDELADDSTTAQLQFDPKPVATSEPKPDSLATRPARTPADQAASKQPAAQRLRLMIRRINGYQGRVLRGCGSARFACRVTRVSRHRRLMPAFVRLSAVPVPQSGKRTVVLLMQERVGRRWVTRRRPSISVLESGATDARLPPDWRVRSGSWRMRVQTRVPRGKRPVASSFLHFRVR
jgi:uncharacterized delta-60 repeat protein